MARELVESRRTQYTRRALRDALIELLADKPLARITVRELCERADVNRSTFYAHYPDLDSLLRDIEEDTIDWVNGTLQQLLERPDPDSVGRVIEHVCRYIADNRSHLRVLMSPQADVGFQQQLLGLIYSRHAIAEQLQNAAADPAEAQMRMRFAVSGSIGLLQYWLSTDLEASPEAVAHTIFTMGMPTGRRRPRRPRQGARRNGLQSGSMARIRQTPGTAGTTETAGTTRNYRNHTHGEKMA